MPCGLHLLLEEDTPGPSWSPPLAGKRAVAVSLRVALSAAGDIKDLLAGSSQLESEELLCRTASLQRGCVSAPPSAPPASPGDTWICAAGSLAGA